MHVSKRVVAREWLVFLFLFGLGCPASYFLGHFERGYSGHKVYWIHSDYFGFDDFWNRSFGLDYLWNLGLWLVPYLAVMLIRSICWSIKNLNISKRALYGTAVCLAAIVVSAATIPLMNAKGRERKAAVSRAETEEKFATQLLWQGRFDATQAQLVNAANNWHIAKRPDKEKRARQKEQYLREHPPTAITELFIDAPGLFEEVPPSFEDHPGLFDDLIPRDETRPMGTATPR